MLNVSAELSEHPRKIRQAAASAFLYLFLSLGSQQSPPCIYTLRSTIPIGAGLGSSASISVCLSAALLLQIRALSGPHPDQPCQESALQLERINRWAFVGELCIHGNPSGVDNTVSSFGKAVLFQRTDYSKPPVVKPLLSFPELPLLLVNTRQSRSTAVEVAKVAALKAAHPSITSLLLDAIGATSTAAHDLIVSKGFGGSRPDSLHRLGELITVNHGLLVSLGVSHPKLERIRALIDHAGIGWTKLTGAGGGGCAITILKPMQASNGAASSDEDSASEESCPPPEISSVRNILASEGFDAFATTLAGDGVGVLWPAVLRNGRGEDDQGGEEIDQEKFLTAEGAEGIEALVGVVGAQKMKRRASQSEGRAGRAGDKNQGATEATRDGWRFWTV